MAFKVGEVVQLKSGGPALTIVEAKGSMVSVIFFSEADGSFKREDLPAAAVEAIEFDDEDDDE